MTISCAIITISDTRTAKTDESGQILQERMEKDGHNVFGRYFAVDEVNAIQSLLNELINEAHVDVVITTGGTGITKRDVTPEAIRPLSTKHIPGFGELFRMLSFRDVGTSTIQSRADAWLCQSTLIFALPGSPKAIALAWDEILSSQLNEAHQPCNFVRLLPRIK